MAVLKEDSSKRRRSIAVTNQNRPTIAAPVGKRRAHSIAPGDRQSPLAKARRSIAPRKSILKASSIVNTEEAYEQSSQPSQSQLSLHDDGNITQSMDLTVDYQARIHDNASRKSFGRRVSFAEHAQVRLFQIPESNHTNSTGSPQSSPIQPSPESNNPPTLSNENDYPASFSRSRRRSSVRYSIAGGEDMDLTSANPAAFLQDETSLLDEELDYDDSGDDMDVTNVHGEFIRKRSLSLSGRQPFAPVRGRDSIVFPSDDAIPSDDDQTQSVLEGDSQLQTSAEQSREMEFTVPMGQSLRPPATEDPVWLALRQVTHSGDTPPELEPSSEDIGQVGDQHGMDLNDAMARLMRARDSFAGNTGDITEDMDITTATPGFVAQDDSLMSTDDSLSDDNREGNATLNISKAIRHIGLDREARTSLSYQDLTMDESGVYGSIVPLSSSTPRPSITTGTQQEDNELNVDSQAIAGVELPASAVFKLPSGSAPPPPSAPTATKEQSSKSTPFTFVPPATGQQSTLGVGATLAIKPKPKPSFSAAFAPPVAKPSPRRFSNSSTPAQTTPSKRPFSALQDNDATSATRPSPAKRQALDLRTTKEPSGRSQSPLQSPSKRVTPAVSNLTAAKRPSGYFARRKSLGSGLSAMQGEDSSITAPTSPQKKISTGHGRTSLSSAPSDAWKRFDRNATGPSIPPNISSQSRETQASYVREAARRATASPTPTRGSPAPASPKPATPLGWTPLESADPATTVLTNATDVDGSEGVQDAIELDLSMGQVEDAAPSISIEQFFSMTSIKFMDELTAPRRSIHPQNGSCQARNLTEIPLSEYYIAMGIDVPQLGLFTRVSKDLEGWMERSKADFTQAEEEAAKITPELFIEFMRADEEGQAELLHQLNLIRVNARGQARSDWYDWKLRWVEGLHITAEQAFHDLQNDANILEPIKRAAEELVPTLEKEYNEIMQELEREQAEVAEIESSDQEYLNDLKVSVAEQNIEVEALRAELSEHSEQLNYLQSRLQELGIQKKEATDAIATAQRVLQIQKNSTRAEVFRLRDELETLEDLHRFRIIKVNSDIFEYVYASHYKVTIPCKIYLPTTAAIDITRVGNSLTQLKNDFPQLSNVFLIAAKSLITQGTATSCREVVRRLGNYWSSCSQLRSQLRLLLVKYPVEIVLVGSAASSLPGFQAKTKVMIPSRKAKVFISFNFTSEIFSRWPLSISSLTCDVDVAYGAVDRSTLSQAVTERLSQATPSDNYACLLDACIEAQELYNR